VFEKIEEGWREQRQRDTRWTVYRAWMGVGIALLTIMVMWLEKSAK
jgi:hypothetical protein